MSDSGHNNNCPPHTGNKWGGNKATRAATAAWLVRLTAPANVWGWVRSLGGGGGLGLGQAVAVGTRNGLGLFGVEIVNRGGCGGRGVVRSRNCRHLCLQLVVVRSRNCTPPRSGKSTFFTLMPCPPARVDCSLSCWASARGSCPVKSVRSRAVLERRHPSPPRPAAVLLSARNHRRGRGVLAKWRARRPAACGITQGVKTTELDRPA